MKVYDVRLEPDGYSFRFAGADEDRALRLLRQAISPADLAWREPEGRWWIAPGYEVILGRLFEDFDRGLAQARLRLDPPPAQRRTVPAYDANYNESHNQGG